MVSLFQIENQLVDDNLKMDDSFGGYFVNMLFEDFGFDEVLQRENLRVIENNFGVELVVEDGEMIDEIVYFVENVFLQICM